jgi:hypothetical protein
MIKHSTNNNNNNNNNLTGLELQSAGDITPHVRMSGTDVRVKEVILVCLALALLIFSVSLFFKHWKKNYWDINQLPYYAYLYKVSGFHIIFLLFFCLQLFCCIIRKCVS